MNPGAVGSSKALKTRVAISLNVTKILHGNQFGGMPRIETSYSFDGLTHGDANLESLVLKA